VAMRLHVRLVTVVFGLTGSAGIQPTGTDNTPRTATKRQTISGCHAARAPYCSLRYLALRHRQEAFEPLVIMAELI